MRSKKISFCENCGDRLSFPVEKWPEDFIICGSRECNQAERDFHRLQQQDRRELDRDTNLESW